MLVSQSELVELFIPTARYPLIKNCFHKTQLEKHLLEDTPLVKENKKRTGEKKGWWDLSPKAVQQQRPRIFVHCVFR